MHSEEGIIYIYIKKKKKTFQNWYEKRGERERRKQEKDTL